MLTGDNVMGKLWSNDKISPVLTSACGQNVSHKIAPVLQNITNTVSYMHADNVTILSTTDHSLTYNIIIKYCGT